MASRKALPAVDPQNPRCYFDITLAGEPGAPLKGVLETRRDALTLPCDAAGRLIFELFTDRAPCASENFRCLCTGAPGPSCGLWQAR